MSASNSSIEKIKEKWTKNIDNVIFDEIWDDALKRVNVSTTCARLSLIQFKILHRTYYTKSRLSKIYPNVDDRCDRCKTDKADLIHMFWSCQKMKNYWTLVFKTLNEAFNLNITPCVEIAIFGVPEHGIPLTNNLENVFAFASLLSKKENIVGMEIKKSTKTSMWICDLILYLKLEKNKCQKRIHPKIL